MQKRVLQLIASIYMTFLAVAETGSFSKAAGKLFVSPVAVMNQMNELEGEVKAVLFVRTNRGVSLTRAGQMLQTKLLAIKKQTDQAMAEVRAISAKDKVRIRVGASMMRPATLLTALWQDSELLQRNFSLQIIPFDDNQFNAKWLSSVLGTEFDCITSPYDVKEWYKNFCVFKLGEEKFKLAVPFSHPLSQKEILTLADLSHLTILTPPRESPAVDKLCKFIEKTYPNIRTEPLAAFYTANTFMEHPHDILLTRESFKIMSSAFRTIDVEWDFSSPTGIIFALKPLPQAAGFISILKQVLKISP
ncbi:LysR family transcriptional regulator [Mitsuokella sp. AF21-1AC]|nr:LysR family transcriptional regulator [Mitsuokella sp. AF21-1AC]